MSYILDALRKSDQQRRRGAVPTLMVAQTTAVASKQSANLYYGLFAVVLVAVGIFIGWLRPWQAESAPRVTEPVAFKPAEISTREAAPLRALPETAPRADSVPPKEVQALQPARAPVAARSETFPRADTPKRRTPSTSAATARPMTPAQPVDAGTAAPAQPVIAMGDLPLAIQQELPPMSISVHAYSGKPRERLVGINNQLLHEGDSAAPGLKLEQITPDGMIFSYKGFSFRRGVQ